MLKRIGIICLVSVLFLSLVHAYADTEMVFEDYNDQDYSNHFSGDWNKWENATGSFILSFDTTHARGSEGACLRVDYAVPQGGYGWVWHSLLGKVDYKKQHLNFTDLYGDLKNSSGNPTDILNINVTHFSFWARGNGSGSYNHVVKAELKDTWGPIASKIFTIPNTGRLHL
jgi:hypothetical protein